MSAVAALALVTASCQKPEVHAQREADPALTSKEILSMDDQNFLINAEKSEIRRSAFAKSALEKSANIDIQKFARRVQEQSERDLQELRTLMTTKKIPSPPGLAEEIELESTSRLHLLSGSAFDDEFLSLMTADQQESISSFDSAANTASDPDIRAYAARVLPSLRKDFDTTDALEKKINSKNAR
jgi:putative membrane protein